MTTYFAVALLMASTAVEAAISTNGLWTDNDHVQRIAGVTYKYTNGIPGSEDADTNRRIKAPQALPESEMSDYEQNDNVVRVDKLIGIDNWNYWFSLADTGSGMTYENFLKAVAKFPYFCNDHNEAQEGLNTENIDQTCKRELATLFAHIAFESGENDPWHASVSDKYRQGLAHVQDI